MTSETKPSGGLCRFGDTDRDADGEPAPDGYDKGLAPANRQWFRRAYWLVYHESVRQLRRIQVVAAFIAGLVEKDRALFL